MTPAARQIQRTYLSLVLLNTLAASLIWGINTIFLLDAGLSNLEAFAANAFFTAGMVLFEVPTGVVADLKGRRLSFLLGTLTLAFATLAYLLLWQVGAPFWGWAVVSVFLGLGFTFFSGATEAWLVDALTHTGFTGRMETVFAKGQIVTGIGMLVGTIGGGILAQVTNLGVPYIVRCVALGLAFILAFLLMRDLGFTPERGKRPLAQIKQILSSSIRLGLRNPPVRWVMLTAPFIAGVSIYGFYALQPYLLELWGNEQAYGIAGLAAGILASAQIAGGVFAPQLRRFFHRRTTILVTATLLGAVALTLMGVFHNFWAVILLVCIWGVVYAAATPVRQAYINGLIPTKQRATVLSFDSLMGSSGGVVIQPALGKSADIWNYSTSYLLSGGIYALALPFAWAARRTASRGAAKQADAISQDENPTKTE
ncbi:MAG TPA: MFS transporter [Candidatus Saccharimonadales bacterium]|nr:MFS transporter [Candidatus Saccharimonadales bacterium]